MPCPLLKSFPYLHSDQSTHTITIGLQQQWSIVWYIMLLRSIDITIGTSNRGTSCCSDQQISQSGPAIMVNRRLNSSPCETTLHHDSENDKNRVTERWYSISRNTRLAPLLYCVSTYPTFLSSKLTFLSSKLTFLSYITDISQSWPERFPFTPL